MKNLFVTSILALAAVTVAMTPLTANAQVLTFNISGTVQQNDLGYLGERPLARPSAVPLQSIQMQL